MDKLWPDGTYVDNKGELWIGGCPVSRLAGEHGTPLYIFDEATLRARARAYQAALARYYPGTAQTAYASKAYLNLAVAQLFAEEGLDLDVVSGGELYVALEAGFAPERIHFHGNNKSPDELAEALDAGIGRIVVDNFYELQLLGDLAARAAGTRRVPIWLRLSPGIQAHTHAHIQTGHLDTKFGFAIATGDAERAVVEAMAQPALQLLGLHTHIGSQIYEAEALSAAAVHLAEFAAEMRAQYGFELQELSPGGGWGVPMTEEDPEAPVEPFVATLSEALVTACRQTAMPLPHLVLEPGRSLIARAAVALYRVGARKEIPGAHSYVSVDGGMADNIRPALYGAVYRAHVVPGEGRAVRSAAKEAGVPEMERVTIAGKYCESGDVLIRDIELPHPKPGDLLAIPMAGAYTLSMASNYNLSRRPAAVLVAAGNARLMQRRESYGDLLARDFPLHERLRPPARRAEPRSEETPLFRFAKYQALGNDYIVLDPVDFPQVPEPQLIRRVCDRHLGIGSDGILWGPLLPVGDESEPFRLRLFNPDGGEFEKSGNGLRIFARYLWDRGLPSGPDYMIDTPGGLVTAHVLDSSASRIAMDMGVLSFDSTVIPVNGPAREVVDEPVTLDAGSLMITAAGIGNPHCVVFIDQRSPVLGGVKKPTSELAHSLGPRLEGFSLFPNRTNVQFARVVDKHTLEIEIWERGAGYTLASGTSSCAAAGAAIRTGRCASPVTVRMPGGEMLVEIANDWTVRLTGSVSAVCAGELSAELMREVS